MNFSLDFKILAANNSYVINVSIDDLMNYPWYVKNLLYIPAKPWESSRLLINELTIAVPESFPVGALLAITDTQINSFAFDPLLSKGVATIVLAEKELNQLVRIEIKDTMIALAPPSPVAVLDYLLGN